MDAVARKMSELVDQGKAENWSQSQYQQAVRNLLSDQRQALRSGDVALNAKHRPWAKI